MTSRNLKEENALLRQRINEYRSQNIGSNLRKEIENFLSESKKNLQEMTERAKT